MAEYTRWTRQYHALRDVLIEQLGGKCVVCGRSSMKMHIDHPKGRDWEPREVSSHTRIRRYIKEHKQGLIRLLCDKCNSSRRYDD